MTIPEDKVCLPSKPVLLAQNKTRYHHITFMMIVHFIPATMKNIHRDDYPLGDGQSIMTSAEQFFTYGVLKTRPDNDITDGLGLPDPTLLGALAVTWIILYFSLRGGVGGQGKVGNQVLPTIEAVNLHHHI